MNDNAPAGIRTFLSIAEIEAEPGFVPDNPIDKTNYKRILGDSDLDEEMRCCFRKENGNLCAEGHIHGWVAVLLDDSVTVIGNTCAKNRFDISSQLSADRRRFNTQKQRNIKLSRLSEYLEQREAAEAALVAICDEVVAINTRVQHFATELGCMNSRRLSDMAKTGQTAVTVTAVTIVKYLDEDGEPAQERRPVAHRLGALRGIEIFKSEVVDSLLNGIYSTRVAYRQARDQVFLIKPKPREIEELVATLARSERFPKELERLRALEEAFYTNDYSLFCYLSDNRVERYQAARVAMRQLGIAGGKDQAKAWLAASDERYKQQFRAQQLRIDV